MDVHEAEDRLPRLEGDDVGIPVKALELRQRRLGQLHILQVRRLDGDLADELAGRDLRRVVDEGHAFVVARRIREDRAPSLGQRGHELVEASAVVLHLLDGHQVEPRDHFGDQRVILRPADLGAEAAPVVRDCRGDVSAMSPGVC